MLVSMPLLARIIGIEGYGLVGFFTSLQMVLMTLEGGITASFNRELSRLAGLGDAAAIKQTTSTFLLVYGLLGLIVFLVVYSLASFFSIHGFHAHELEPNIIRDSLVLMGATIGLQFPVNLYQASFAALERLVLFNGIYILFSTIRTIGVVFGLQRWHGNAVDFFTCQLVIQLIFCISLHIFSRPNESENVQHYPVKVISLQLLRSHVTFGSQMILISVMSSLILQSDKFLLGKFSGLTELGYYNMAYLVASMPYIFSSALFAVVFPRATRLVAAANEGAERRLFDQTTQIVAILVLPAAFFLGYFSPVFLSVWIGNPITVSHVAPLFTILLAGVTLQSLQVIPYAFQLAHKWSSFTLKSNLILMPLVLIGYAFGSRMWGGFGTAVVWLAYSCISMLLIHIFLHKRILYDARLTWIKHAFLLPSLISLAILPMAAWLMHFVDQPVARVVLILIGALLATMCSVLLSPALRPILFKLKLNRFP